MAVGPTTATSPKCSAIDGSTSSGNDHTSPRHPHNKLGPLPIFSEGSHFDVERPRRARLMRNVPDFIRNGVWLDEELVFRSRESLSRPLEVDHRVDHDVRDVYALRSEVAGDRFREYPLRRLGRRKPRERGFAT